jgi:hypothetical protein
MTTFTKEYLYAPKKICAASLSVVPIVGKIDSVRYRGGGV